MGKAIALTACIIFFAASLALASLVFAQPQINLISPESGFTTTQAMQEFEFVVEANQSQANQSNQSNCELFLDEAGVNSTSIPLAEGTSTRASMQAILSIGAHEWFVKCGESKSEVRTIFVTQAINASEFNEERELEIPFSGIVTGFSVATGAVAASEGLYIESWQASPGERVSFSANVSNNGALSFNARLVTKVSDAVKQVALIESDYAEVAPGKTIELKNAWIPEKEGEYFVEGSVVEESGRVFQRSFLKLVVGMRQAGGGASDASLFIGVICLIAISFASINVHKDIRSLKKGLE